MPTVVLKFDVWSNIIGNRLFRLFLSVHKHKKTQTVNTDVEYKFFFLSTFDPMVVENKLIAD
jgi:hypothetical protein